VEEETSMQKGSEKHLLSKPRHRRKNDIKLDLKKTGLGNKGYIKLSYDKIF
jgi:hypothetical protein